MPKPEAVTRPGLTGWTGKAARAVARRTGRPEAEILSLIGAVFLAKTLIGFLREVNTDRGGPNRPAASG
jgi:hypothetical protein